MKNCMNQKTINIDRHLVNPFQLRIKAIIPIFWRLVLPIINPMSRYFFGRSFNPLPGVPTLPFLIAVHLLRVILVFKFLRSFSLYLENKQKKILNWSPEDGRLKFQRSVRSLFPVTRAPKFRWCQHQLIDGGGAAVWRKTKQMHIRLPKKYTSKSHLLINSQL